MEKKLAWVTCLTALPLANALKLTPIQPSTQRVDLATESRNTAIALTNALYKIEQGEVPLEHSQQMLESPEMQKLQGVVRRWISMEEKLRNAITPGSTQQVISASTSTSFLCFLILTNAYYIGSTIPGHYS